MRNLVVCARAPSNIALIKYMGKKNPNLNIPENPSLSLTLNSLCTFAELSISESHLDSIDWIAEKPQTLEVDPNFQALSSRAIVPDLGDPEVQKVLRYCRLALREIPEIFKKFGISLPLRPLGTRYLLKTANTFPACSGIASSASSFAAITLAFAQSLAQDSACFRKAWREDLLLRRALAQVSRQGSGSSCRSFEGPWVIWEGEEARAVLSSMPPMAHFVVLIQAEAKKVSSSEAHLRVRTSPLWESRVDRVQYRLKNMISALRTQDVKTLAQVSWSEMWEMHSLFHTCSDPFSYWAPGTIEALQWFSPLIRSEEPPIVTLDAGPNLHVLVAKERQKDWSVRLRRKFSEVLEDEEGQGAFPLEGVFGDGEVQ